MPLRWCQTPPTGTEEPLLRNISFRVPARKLGLIYGRSGAGKTTLLQLLAGLTTPTAGTISITETTGAPGSREGSVLGLAGLTLTAMHPSGSSPACEWLPASAGPIIFGLSQMDSNSS